MTAIARDVSFAAAITGCSAEVKDVPSRIGGHDRNPSGRAGLHGRIVNQLRTFFKETIRHLGDSHIVKGRLACGLIIIMSAISNIILTPATTSSGRWSWLILLAQGAFGRHGWTILEGVIGLALILWAMKRD